MLKMLDLDYRLAGRIAGKYPIGNSGAVCSQQCEGAAEIRARRRRRY